MLKNVRADLLRLVDPGSRYEDNTWNTRKVVFGFLDALGAWAVVEYRFRRWVRTLPLPMRLALKPVSMMTRKSMEIIAGVSRSGPTLRVPSLPVLRTNLIGLPAVFPIAGKHEIGMSAVQRFGGARGHEGQDTFAKCGTPLVAAHGGVVQHNDFEGRAGNYVVIGLPDGTSEAYMHMQEPSPLTVGTPVVAGQPIGTVGDTGDAQGCHLHFELWTAPG